MGYLRRPHWVSRSGRFAKRDRKKFEIPFETWFFFGAPSRGERADAEHERLGRRGGEEHASCFVREVLSVGVDGQRDLVARRLGRRKKRCEALRPSRGFPHGRAL